MTGFGFAETEAVGAQFAVELKSLNTRYMDISVNLPSSLSPLESRVRSLLQERFSRGRLEVIVRFREIEESLQISVDRAAAEAWKNALIELVEVLGTGEEVTLEQLTRQEGVLKVNRNRDIELYWQTLQTLLDTVAAQVQIDREREGAVLAVDIESQISVIETALGEVNQRAPQVRSEVELQLRQRFREVLGDELAEQRILVETAAWIAKTDINEEIVRLKTHIKAFRDTVKAGGPVGKKLDFLAQEMGREINTIGSKSSQVDVNQQVVNMKDALEKVREQLRNVE